LSEDAQGAASVAGGLADLHVHTARCGHASGPIADYVSRARELGLAEIGFSDHLPLVGKQNPTLAMPDAELPAYVRDVLEARAEASGDLIVRLGIEADWSPGTEDALAKMLSAHPFDYVLGSVHWIGDWAFDHPDHMDGYDEIEPERFWEEYFQAAARAAASGLFDVMAHPDLAKKFDVWPGFDPSASYDAFADTVAAAGLAVEINTSGLSKPVAEIYPSRGLLERLRAREVPVTLGSDAHRPSEVGRSFGEAVALAWEVGYREAVTFEGRRRVSYALQAPRPTAGPLEA
jgi:histidinol-phosphatase (PHP family)